MATPFEHDQKKSKRALALLRKAAVKVAERDGVQFSVWTPKTEVEQTNTVLPRNTVYAGIMIGSPKTRHHRSAVK